MRRILLGFRDFFPSPCKYEIYITCVLADRPFLLHIRQVVHKCSDPLLSYLPKRAMTDDASSLFVYQSSLTPHMADSSGYTLFDNAQAICPWPQIHSHRQNP